MSLLEKKLIFPMAKERSSRKLILARLLTIRHIAPEKSLPVRTAATAGAEEAPRGYAA
jgi:hypothetical protein